MGRVVNITKFGAFVNILPGRDGLVHISKLGGGKRINAVEDVLELGQEIEVRVDEIDDKGKVSLLPVGDSAASGGGDSAPAREPRSSAPRSDDSSDDASSASSGGSDVVEVSFEDSFDAELADELGDLGPKAARTSGGGGGERRGGGGGGGRRRHR